MKKQRLLELAGVQIDEAMDDLEIARVLLALCREMKNVDTQTAHNEIMASLEMMDASTQRKVKGWLYWLLDGLKK